jgi:hypothetical protein
MEAIQIACIATKVIHIGSGCHPTTSSKAQEIIRNWLIPNVQAMAISWLWRIISSLR